jgi:hypothetical protein
MGVPLNPLSIRKLRTTYVCQSIDEQDGRLIDKEGLRAEYALASGHTIDVMEKYYLLKDTQECVSRSRNITDLSNQYLFGGEATGESEQVQRRHVRFEDEETKGTVWNEPPSGAIRAKAGSKGKEATKVTKNRDKLKGRPYSRGGKSIQKKDSDDEVILVDETEDSRGSERSNRDEAVSETP